PSGESDSIRLNVKKRRTVDSSPEESRATLAKTSNPSSEKSTPNDLDNSEDNAKALTEVDEILKRSQQKRPERPPAYQRRPSVQVAEDVENSVKKLEEERRGAEQRARAEAERKKAIEAERL